jgi:predicted nucleic acid-binding protein
LAFVLDASATLPWHFGDEASEHSAQLLTRADSGEQIYVVSHWPAEILNALTRASRRGTDDPTTQLFLTSLLRYNISIDEWSMGRQWAGARPLILKHRHCAYNAAYLALAIRLNVQLATFDEQLRLAAESEGVPLAI